MTEIVIWGPFSVGGPTETILRYATMFGQTRCYDRSLDARDAKMAKIKSQLSLAERARNKAEVTRLTRELGRLGGSW